VALGSQGSKYYATLYAYSYCEWPNVKYGLDSRTHIPEMKIALILADMERTVNIK